METRAGLESMKRNGEIHSDRSSVTWPLDPVSDPVGRAERAIPRARRSREEKETKRVGVRKAKQRTVECRDGG